MVTNKIKKIKCDETCQPETFVINLGLSQLLQFLTEHNIQLIQRLYNLMRSLAIKKFNPLDTCLTTKNYHQKHNTSLIQRKHESLK